MEGDFTRNSDDPEARYSGVLMQQGRVQLDADWNEQWLIQTRAVRDALRDMIGRHGGPVGDLGFQILGPGASGGSLLRIGPGVYYVDGIRCEHRGEAPLDMGKRDQGQYLAFLEVWERHVNAIQDPRLREIALLGPDTATRAAVTWRVRLLPFKSTDLPTWEQASEVAESMIERVLRQRPRLRLAARAQTTSASTDPCELSPLARYRGKENQLYRVQLHDAAPTAASSDSQDPVLFTLKWSRDNGSVVFPILPLEIPRAPATAGDREIVVSVKVGHLGRDERYGLVANDIVEFVDDAAAREALDDIQVRADGFDPGRTGLLGRVLAPIDPDDLTVPIAVYAPDRFEGTELALHPYLRRWDHGRGAAAGKLRDGAIPVRRSQLSSWLPIEDGVEVQLQGDEKRLVLAPRAGDYWLIPARTATGDVEWPTDEGGTPTIRTPRRVPPHGPERHWAPLALLSWNGTLVTEPMGVRKQFYPIAYQEPPR